MQTGLVKMNNLVESKRLSKALYLRSTGKGLSCYPWAGFIPGRFLSIENDTKCNFEMCDSLAQIVLRLGLLSITQSEPALLLIDSSVFAEYKATIREIINMIFTMTRCMPCVNKISVGVVISEKCTLEFLKELQETEIMGIVPYSDEFGYEHAVQALNELLEYKPYWSKSVINIVTGKAVQKKEKKGIYLTDRQKQVLSLVCNRGLSNKKIAQVLNISESTVKIHVSAILKQYGVRNRTQLALAANLTLHA